MSPRQVDERTLHDREQQMLDAAVLLLENIGVEGLTMDKLVKEVPFSKGTVYSHFTGKEDVLLALCNRGMGLLGGYFRRAYLFNGSTRERMLALMFAYLIYSQIYPMLFMLVISAKAPGVIEKASEKRRNEHHDLEQTLFASVGGIIQDALDCGDCQNPNGLTLEEIAYTGWASSFGAITLMAKGAEDCVVRGELCPQRVVLTSVHTHLDGLQWLPLLRDYNFEQTVERLKREDFATEVQLLMTRCGQ